MLEILKMRFFENKSRHPGLEWPDVERRILAHPQALDNLQRMEKSGGEPDTIGFDKETGKLIYCDCSKESPLERRSLCYDEDALKKRKKTLPRVAL